MEGYMMSNELTKGGDSRELSTDINIITAEINAYQRVAGEAILEIGRRLKHVKENDLAHGKYIEWIESIGMNRTTAYRFVKVYEEFGANDDTWQHLSMRALYEIATLPPEQRDVPHELPTGETKKPEEMTVREIEELKRKLKAEQAERERLEKENEELANREPETVIKTEYVEVRDEYTEQRAEQAEKRLKQYEERFGDIRDYDENITATHRQDMIVAVMSFSKGVREFIKRYDYMNRYKDVINNLDKESRQQYNEAVKALKELADTFEYTEDLGDIIDADYSEII